MDKMDYIKLAIELSASNIGSGHGGPFGAVVVKQGRIIGQGCNQVLKSFDPTAHAEVVAIRQACLSLQSHNLTGCEIYASCEPCPMCLAAIHWSRINKVYYAADRKDAAAIGFDDEVFYQELAMPAESRLLRMQQLEADEAVKVMKSWLLESNSQLY